MLPRAPSHALPSACSFSARRASSTPSNSYRACRPLPFPLHRARAIAKPYHTNNSTFWPNVAGRIERSSARRKYTTIMSVQEKTQNVKDSILNWVKPGDKSGEFKRQDAVFRNWIENKPDAEFPPEKGRYHLYVCYACPWAHRSLITRKLKGLEDFISYTAVHWDLGEKGWRFVTADEKLPGEFVEPDPLHPDFTHLRDIYFAEKPDYSGRFTVPTLYDKKSKRIVSNESSEIIRMLYYAFDDLLPEQYKKVELFPQDLRKEIEAVNEWTYHDINNGVYKSGFATTQTAYENNVTTLFKSLDRVESHLRSSHGPYYHGDRLTEADIRLYPTIIRFDPVYVQHFKCNIRDIRSGYPAIHAWLRRLYWDVPAFGSTTQFEHIKKHYTKSQKQISPFGITPVGPLPDILEKGEEVESVRAGKL